VKDRTGQNEGQDRPVNRQRSKSVHLSTIGQASRSIKLRNANLPILWACSQ